MEWLEKSNIDMAVFKNIIAVHRITMLQYIIGNPIEEPACPH